MRYLSITSPTLSALWLFPAVRQHSPGTNCALPKCLNFFSSRFSKTFNQIIFPQRQSMPCSPTAYNFTRRSTSILATAEPIEQEQWSVTSWRLSYSENILDEI